jgi:hypothetical protein
VNKGKKKDRGCYAPALLACSLWALSAALISVALRLDLVCP